MSDWTDANINLSDNNLYTPNKGPDDDGAPSYVWRAQWPPDDNTYTWMYFLDRKEDIVGFEMDDPFAGRLDNHGSDTRYYVTNGWPSEISYVVDGQQLAAMGTVLTHDNVTGGKHDDWLLPGPGNDRVNGNPGTDFIAGGSGDDLLLGDEGGDTLYGDGFDAPIVLHQDFAGQGFEWELPTDIDPDVVDGNDQLFGGPRGDGWTDVLTGGGGADAFYLSYTDTNSSSDGSTFWSGFGENYVAGIGGGAAFNGVNDLTAAAATDFFESLTGSVLLGGLDTAVGGLASDGLSLLLGMNQSATPKSSGEDVMVITDFDPREDVLFLPVATNDQNDSATTLTSSAKYYSESAAGANGQTGWGIEFTRGTGNTVFAEVFLDPDFLGAFDVTENSEFADDFIHDVFDTSLVIDDTGVQNQQNVYPFPTDASAYTDGVVPAVADTPVAFTAPSGTTTKVFGAFGGLSFVAPTTTTTGVYVSGTNLSDILSVNLAFFDPADATTSGDLTSESSHVMAFGGDDIVFGGNGLDTISGGDGDDTIYGIGNSNVETSESFSGDAGDDTVYLGFTSSWVIVDGGDDNDMVSFSYLDNENGNALTVDLAKTTETASAMVSANDSTVSRYDISNVENVTGSDQADTLTGNADDNIIQGNGGSDTLDGGEGTDTASYADNEGRVEVDLAAGAADEYDSDGNAASTDTLAGFENAIGSAFDDSLTGDGSDMTLAGGAGSDTLDGGGGTNTLTYAANTGAVDVDIADGTTDEYGPNGGSNSTVVASTDSFSNFQNFVATPFEDSLRNGPDGGYVIDGGDSDDILQWASVDNGVNVDLSKGTVSDNGFGKQDTLISIEDVDGTDFGDTLTGDDNANQLRGFDGNDVLTGGDGDDDIITGDGLDTVMAGLGADTIELSQSATNPNNYQKNTVTGTFSEWDGDTVTDMGFNDILIVQNFIEGDTLDVVPIGAGYEVTVISTYSFIVEVVDQALGSSMVPQVDGNDLHLLIA